MTNKSNVKIIAFVGLPGSGKSTAVDYLSQKDIPKIYMGGIIYKAMEEAGIEINFESQQKFREEIRAREGKDFVAKRAIEQINNLIDAGQKQIIVDGIYTWTEYKLFKRAFPGEMTVVAVVTPKPLRKRRLAQRPERPLTSVEVDQRDWAEIENLEKGGPIALADFYVHNNRSYDEFYTQIDEILDEIDFKTAN